MIERGFRHSWLHGSDRPSARVPAVRSQDQETPRGSVERRHGRIVKKDVEDQCGFQTIDVFVGQWMPDATAIERKLHRKFLSRPRDTKHPLGAPRCWRVAGADFNFERGAHLLRWHRVFFTSRRRCRRCWYTCTASLAHWLPAG
jgi:hypothetical protein